jgi:hypothetical protein
MNKLLSLSCVLTSLVLIQFCLPQAGAAESFVFDFDQGIDEEYFKVFNNSGLFEWEVTDGSLRFFKGPSEAGKHRIELASRIGLIGDFTISVDFHLNTPLSSQSGAGNLLQFETYVFSLKKEFGFLAVRSNDGATIEDGECHVWIMPNNMQLPVPVMETTDQSGTFTITRVGNLFTAYLGSEFIAQYTLNDLPYTVALALQNNGTGDALDASFDNLLIEAEEVTWLPVADAGSDQYVPDPGTLVTLDGSASYDLDNDYPLTYQWKLVSKPAGSSAVLSNPDTVNPAFNLDAGGDYLLRLSVTDSRGARSRPDAVIITTDNTAPVADAGPDQAVIQIGTLIHLDGSQSYDVDGDEIDYAWSLISRPTGSTAFLDDPASATPTFMADVHGDYTLGLTVTDRFGVSSDQDLVVIGFDNIRPVAEADPGEYQSVEAGETVIIDGSDSYDDNLDPLTYRWSLLNRPEGSLAELSSPDSVITDFVADVPGEYIVSLVVNDGFVDSEPSNVVILAVSVKDQIKQLLMDAIAVINGLGKEHFKNKNLRKTLTNKINVLIKMVDEGAFDDAGDKLENDVMKKTNGFAETGAVDKNDWIVTGPAQDQVYPLLLAASDYLNP